MHGIHTEDTTLEITKYEPNIFFVGCLMLLFFRSIIGVSLYIDR